MIIRGTAAGLCISWSTRTAARRSSLDLKNTPCFPCNVKTEETDLMTMRSGEVELTPHDCSHTGNQVDRLRLHTGAVVRRAEARLS